MKLLTRNKPNNQADNPVKVTDQCAEKGGENRLLRRKSFLEAAIRITFGALCGCFFFTQPVTIVLFLLFLAYMYVVQM